MKKLTILAGLFFATAFAQAENLIISPEVMNQITVEAARAGIINWKVGDTQVFDLKISALPIPGGTMTKTVTKDEGDTLWFSQDMNLIITNQKAEIQINKADGKVLKIIVGGQEQQIPDSKIEIVSATDDKITVPAGSFPCLHIVAKDGSGQQIEVWMNIEATCMSGELKMIAPSQMGTITLELKSFKKTP